MLDTYSATHSHNSYKVKWAINFDKETRREKGKLLIDGWSYVRKFLFASNISIKTKHLQGKEKCQQKCRGSETQSINPSNALMHSIES